MYYKEAMDIDRQGMKRGWGGWERERQWEEST